MAKGRSMWPYIEAEIQGVVTLFNSTELEDVVGKIFIVSLLCVRWF